MASKTMYDSGSTEAWKWYPGSRSELLALLDSFYSKAGAKFAGKVKALLVPHAGYAYSGQVAAYAFKQVEKEDYGTVIILAPSHQYPMDGIAVSNRAHYHTPLGEVAVSALAEELQKALPAIKNMPEDHPHEHAAEMVVPFLQRSLSGFEIVPVIIGKASFAQIDALADLLIKHLDDRTLIVATTDLSHYCPYGEAVAKDKSCVDAILAGDFRNASRCEMCGYYSVVTLMRIAQKMDWSSRLLKYMNSGDVTGDRSAVVGFASVAFYGAEKGRI